MTIVPMETRHLPALAKLEKVCFSTPWSENALKETLDSPGALFLVAEENAQVCGYIGCQCVLDEGYITNVAVSPAYRRKGVGRALVAALCTCAAQKGLAFVTLEVRASNAPALALYEQAGFQPAGRRREYYRAPREDALLLTWYYKKG